MFKSFNKAISTPIAIIIIIVLASFAIGTVLAYQYWWAPEKEAESSIDEITEWTTYKNEDYGFEIKYPSNWYFNEDFGGPFSNRADIYDDSRDMRFLTIYISEKDSYPYSVVIEVINKNFTMGTRDWQDFKLGQIIGRINSLNCLTGCSIFVNESSLIISVDKDPLKDEMTEKILLTFKPVEINKRDETAIKELTILLSSAITAVRTSSLGIDLPEWSIRNDIVNAGYEDILSKALYSQWIGNPKNAIVGSMSVYRNDRNDWIDRWIVLKKITKIEKINTEKYEIKGIYVWDETSYSSGQIKDLSEYSFSFTVILEEGKWVISDIQF